MAIEALLRRLDRLLAAHVCPSETPRETRGKRARGGLTPRSEAGASWPEPAWGNPSSLADRTDPKPGSAPVGTLMVVTASLVCVTSAAALSMVMPYRPSVSQITDFFATSVPGYDQQQGIPRLDRTDPFTNDTGIPAGNFILRPTLESSIGYDDNVLGERGSPGSTILHTSPTLAVNSNWSRNAIGGYVSVDNAEYLDTPSQTRTDWTAALGGAYAIGRGDATLAYSHLALHEDSTYLDAIATTTPLAFTVDDVRATYGLTLGALTLTPNVDLSLWRFGTATIDDRAVSEAGQDHDTLQTGVFADYALNGRLSLLGTVNVIDSHYLYAEPGAPAPSAVSTLGMAGIDYRYSGALRVRVLLGAESREFASGFYRSRVAPIGQTTVIWTPTRLTTVTGTLARTLEDAIQADTGGYTYTRAELEVDHELLRNVTLQSHVGVQEAQSLQTDGSQTSVYGGLTAIWRINRLLQLTMTYQYTSQTGQSGVVQPIAANAIGLGAFNRNVVAVRLRAAL